METIIMSGRRRMMISVPASVNSSSPMVVPSSMVISSSTRLIHGSSRSFISNFFTLSPLLLVAFKNQAGIVASKAHGVGHGYIHRGLACFVGHVIEIALRVGMMQVDGWRDDTRQNGHDGDNALDGSRCTQSMAQH